MAQTITAALSIIAAQDPNLNLKTFSEIWSQKDSASYAYTTVKTVAVPASTLEAIGLGEITTAKVLYIRSDRQIEVQLTSSEGTDQSVIVGPAAASEGVLFLLGEYTALKIQNNDGSTEANATILAMGS